MAWGVVVAWDDDSHSRRIQVVANPHARSVKPLYFATRRFKIPIIVGDDPVPSRI